MKLRLVDETQIIKTSTLSNSDYLVLNLLYQPIIGIEAYSTYMTFINISKNNELVLHKYICDILNLTIIKFEKARKLLEGIGLLDSYYKDDKYIYEVKMPQSANSFFNDGILGSVLKSKIGEELFNYLVKRFECVKANKIDYENITAKFDDCFVLSDIDAKVEVPIVEKKNAVVKMKSSFNFDLFYNKIQNWINKEDKTKKFIDDITSLANLYKLNESDMKNVFMKCTDSNKSFKYEMLYDETKKYSDYKYSKSITIEVKDEIKMVYENKSRDIFLRRCNRVLDSEMQMIDELLAKTGLSSDVMNRLVEYVLDKTDNVVPNSKYFEKVAADWISKGIKNNDDVNKFLDNDNRKPKTKKSEKIADVLEEYKKQKRGGLDE